MTATQQQVFDIPEEDASLAVPVNEAEWVALGDALLRALANIRGERGANSAALKVEAERLKARYEILDMPLERREANLLLHLEEVAKALPLRGKKSRDLASGTIGWRVQKARLELEDEKAALAWAETLPFPEQAQVIRRVEKSSIDKKGLDSFAAAQGITPPGCSQVPEGQRFFAKPSGEAPES